MNARLPFLLACSVVSVVLGALAAQGCGSAPSYFYCNPDASHPSPRCVDAGSEGGSEGGGGGAAAIADCSAGPCVPHPPQGWTGPLWLWHGPAGLYPQQCPEEAPETVYQGVADVVGEPIDCEPCKCKAPEGVCTTLPEKVALQDAPCGLPGDALPFDGPPAWDGSCTSAGALPAGQECPPGSGKPCAQSVSVTRLGAPMESDCTAYIEEDPIPKAGKMWERWETKARACRVPTCDDTGKACLPTRAAPPEGYRQCVSQTGVHDCPENFTGERFVTHDPPAKEGEGVIDTRGCSDCACSLPTGGMCVARFRAYQGGDCSGLIADYYPITSVDGACVTFVKAGTAVGSKSITDLQYVPGSCAPADRHAIGTVEPEPGHETTFCCE